MSGSAKPQNGRVRPAETNIADLRAFVAVVEQGSFSRAAAHLGISQPTVSVRLQNLEDHLGLRLIDRRQSGAVPTETGRPVYNRARRLLTEAEEFETTARELEALQRGHLRIGFTSPSTTLSIVGEYRRANPGVDLELVQYNTWDLQAALKRGEVDLGVMTLFEPLPEPFLCLRVLPQRLAAIVPRNHPLAVAGPVPWAALLDQPLVLRKPPSMTFSQIERELSQRGRAMTPYLSLPSREAVKDAVIAGLGVGLIYASEVGEDQRLATVEIADAAEGTALYVVAFDDVQGLPAVSAFLDCARMFLR